ncbi:MAG: NAD(P)-dependent oxidoreductase [Pelolinea sp.]|nr:NAD(P)-dependent oxidoreductase [Pelolinea sp.]
MKPALNVHILKSPQTDFIDFLQQKLDPNIIVSLGDMVENTKDTSILVAGHPTRELLASLPNLKALIIPWAGVAPETLDLMRDFPMVSIHNLHHNALPVAEYALALLLSAANTLIPVDRALRANDWRPRYTHTPSILLTGKTTLILGYGNIGKVLAKLLIGFNMTLLATRNSIESPVIEDSVQIFPSNYLHKLLPKSDFLIVTLPLTPFTKGLIGEKELALLPKHAVVVNTGRGDIIDQAALYKALKEHSILAAGIDVWYNYPKKDDDQPNTPPADYPFHKLDNIVMSPHRAGSLNQNDIEILRMTHLAELLNQAARGNPIPNRVDPIKGY